MNNAPWMLVSGDLRKDAPYFVTLGFLCGIVQMVSYNYFDKANWGGDLLLEHIAFRSVAFSILFLWTARAVLLWQGDKREMRHLRRLIDHVSDRTVVFASVGASVVFGFAMVPAIWGAYWYAGMFVLCSFYLVCLAEVAANPLLGKGGSRTHAIAMGVVIGTPFAL